MHLTPRPQQVDSAAFLYSEIERGGDITVNVPLEYGRTIIIVKAAQMTGKPVAFMSRIKELREQVKVVAERMSVNNVTVLNTKSDVTQFYAVILSQELLNHQLQHSRIVRQY